MAAKTLHELEIELEKLKVLLEVLRRDLDIISNTHKQEVTILDKTKPDVDAGENIK